MTPIRIQRKTTKGWRMPENTVYVGGGSRWASPYRVGHTKTRSPGALRPWNDWEHEGRLDKPVGEKVRFSHHDNTVTWHHVDYATAAQCVELYRQLLGLDPNTRLNRAPNKHWRTAFIERVRAELAGKNLACWCPLTDAQGNHVPCHADVLLEIANQQEEQCPSQ